MEFVDLITNPGLDPINSKILDSLNYEELKHCCQTSKAIEHYIKTYCEKWKLLEKLQERKYVMKSRIRWIYSAEELNENFPEMDQEEDVVDRDETPIINLFGKFGSETFEYFEKNGNNEQLALFLDFIQAYLDDENTPFWIYPIDFAVKNKRTDFVNLMVPAPMLFTDLTMMEVFADYGTGRMHQAVANNDIEMVKLLMKYSQEKEVHLNSYSRHWNQMNIDENPFEMATRLEHYKIAQLIQDVSEGKIDKKDLKPVIRRFK